MESNKAISLSQKCWRYHEKKFLYYKDFFYKTFEDGPWKWKAQERYSPAYVCCGHYLSLSKEGAEAEAQYYRINKSKRCLLAINLEIDSILDLTNEDILLEIYTSLIVKQKTPKMQILRMLIDDEKGGNIITDEIGIWAIRNGYKGIKYFSARGIKSQFEYFSLMNSSDHQCGLYVAGEYFEILRENLTTQNLVVFSGRYLTPGIKQYWKTPCHIIENPYYNFSPIILDSLLKYNKEDWDCRLANFIRLKTERWFEVPWDGKVKVVDPQKKGLIHE